MKFLLAFSFIFFLLGCGSLSVGEGVYEITAIDSSGKIIRQSLALTQDSASPIYVSIGGMCRAYPESTVIVKNKKTGEPFGEPKKCR